MMSNFHKLTSCQGLIWSIFWPREGKGGKWRTFHSLSVYLHCSFSQSSITSFNLESEKQGVIQKGLALVEEEMLL